MSLFQNLSMSIANSSSSLLLKQGSKALSGSLMQQIYGVEPGKVRFHYYGSNKNLFRILVDSALQKVAGELKYEAKQRIEKAAQELLRGKQKNFENQTQNAWMSIAQDASSENEKYGQMKFSEDKVIWCRDMYGNKCSDGIMLSIPTKSPFTYRTITITSENSKTPSSDNQTTMQTNNLVWYDCTALVSINSDKNVILTKVSGRDYSRKELVSNGDISFQVSGHILSKFPELYPTEEVKKFIEIMQYKGIVRVNNIMLGQFNIDKILIKDFSLSPVEGSKARQDYTFSAVGIQPDSEVEITEDTLYLDRVLSNTESKKENEWSKFIKSKAEGAVYNLTEIADTVASAGINQISI